MPSPRAAYSGGYVVAEGATAFPHTCRTYAIAFVPARKINGRSSLALPQISSEYRALLSCRWQRYQNPGSSHDLPTRISKSAEIRRQWVQEVHGYLGTMRQTSSGRRARTSSALSRHSIGKEAILRARQAEMFAQRRPFVVALKQAAAL